VGLWSRENNWVARAAAWDAELDRQNREAQVQAVLEMNARHAREGRALQVKAMRALRGLAAQGLDAADLLRFLVEGSKLERLARGEVTEAVRQDVQAQERLVLEVVEKIVEVAPSALPGAGETRTEEPERLPASAEPLVSEVIEVADDGEEVLDAQLPDQPPAGFAAQSAP
jgi:hypothetical protein